MNKIPQFIHRIGFCLILICLHPNACSLAQSRQDEVQLWIDQLNDPSFVIREEAFKNLVASGKWAIAHLEKGVASESLETSTRSLNVLARMLDAKDDTTADASLLALRRLASSKNPKIADAAKRSYQSAKEMTNWILRMGGEYDTNELNVITTLRLDRTRGIDPGFSLDPLSDDDLLNLQHLRWLKSLTFEYRTQITDDGLWNQYFW